MSIEPVLRVHGSSTQGTRPTRAGSSRSTTGTSRFSSTSGTRARARPDWWHDIWEGYFEDYTDDIPGVGDCGNPFDLARPCEHVERYPHRDVQRYLVQNARATSRGFTRAASAQTNQETTGRGTETCPPLPRPPESRWAGATASVSEPSPWTSWRSGRSVIRTAPGSACRTSCTESPLQPQPYCGRFRPPAARASRLRCSRCPSRIG